MKSKLLHESTNLTDLWRAHLNIGRTNEGFYFRVPDDCTYASLIAKNLADQSEYIKLKAARIISVECIGRLLI